MCELRQGVKVSEDRSDPHQPTHPHTHYEVATTDGEAYEQALKLAREAGIAAEGQKLIRISLFNRVWRVVA